MLSKSYDLDSPNKIQFVRLADIEPSRENVRLYIERESLWDLKKVYERWRKDPIATVLPDPLVVRYRGEEQPLELLAGERRITAASAAGLKSIPCRIVQMSEVDAYNFILAHNDYKPLSTIERAFRASEMSRLGYSNDEISDALGSIGVDRYIAVGRMVDPNLLTDNRKLCDPGITHWYEAALIGPEHFRECLVAWDAGLWGERQCARNFRKTGEILPLDNTEKGLRLVIDSDKIRIRGTLDLGLLSPDEVKQIWFALKQEVEEVIWKALVTDEFGPRQVFNFNPDTLEVADV